MAFFDEQFLQELKNRCDIIDYIGASVPLKKAGRTYKACCPFHKEKSPSFTVNQDRQAYHCFGCGAHGDVFTFAREFENLDFVAAVTMLAQRAGLPLPEDKGDRPKRNYNRQSLLDIHEDATQFFQSHLQSAAGASVRQYLQGRGITDEDVKTFRIGYAPEGWDHFIKFARSKNYDDQTLQQSGLVTSKDETSTHFYDRFRSRLMFPICNDEGKVIAFSGRTLEKDAKGAKYVNSPETPIFHKSQTLYGLHLARRNFREYDHALLCEGQLDVIACHRAGMNNAVSAQGTAFTEEHARKIKRHCDNIVLAFDGDAAGQKAAVRSIDHLIAAGLNTRVCTLPQGMDPDDYSKEHGLPALKEALLKSDDFFDFLFHSMNVNLADPMQKTRAAEFIISQVAKLPSSLQRSSYCQKIADLLHLPAQSIFDGLNQQMQTREKEQFFQKQREEQRQPQQAAAPQQRTPAEKEFVIPAELTLLELAIHTNESLVHALSHYLPPQFISKSPVGDALNYIIGMTVNQQWREAVQRLPQEFPSSQHISKALVDSLYHKEENEELSADEEKKEQERLNRVLQDCLNTIRKTGLQEELRKITLELRQELPETRQRELKEAYLNTMKKLKEL